MPEPFFNKVEIETSQMTNSNTVIYLTCFYKARIFPEMKFGGIENDFTINYVQLYH